MTTIASKPDVDRLLHQRPGHALVAEAVELEPAPPAGRRRGDLGRAAVVARVERHITVPAAAAARAIAGSPSGCDQALVGDRRDQDRHRDRPAQHLGRGRDLADVGQHPRPQPPAAPGVDVLPQRQLVAAWRRWRLRPRVLTGVGEVSSTAVRGAGWPGGDAGAGRAGRLPAMVDPDGELGMAASAAALAGTVMCLSTLSTTRPAEVAAAAPGGRRWFQLYAFKDAGVARALMEEAIEAGFEAVVVTADAPPGGRPRARRRQSLRLCRRSSADRASWRRHRRRRGELTMRGYAGLRPHLSRVAPTFASECGVPVLVKGVLCRGRRAGARHSCG